MVDDAIVDVENIVRRLREQRAEGIHVPTSSIVVEASVEVRNAIVYASMIEAVALMPVFFLEGLSGAFFQPLALAYVIAVLISGLIAMTITPALSFILLRNAPLENRESPIIAPLHRLYQGAEADSGPAHMAFGAFAILAVAGFGIYPQLGQELLPDFKERDFLMHWLGKPGTSHPEMVRISQLACQELMTIDGVRNCGSHIGQALLMDEVYGIYFGENWISVDPSVDYDETLNEVQTLVDGYPGLYRDVQTYLKERIREVLTGSSHPIVIRIYGEDLDVLREKADEVEAVLLENDGLTDVHVELLVDVPQVDITVDLDKAQEYGVKPGDVRRQAGYLLAGEEAGDIHQAHRTYDVNIWSAPQYRDSMTDIYNLPIETPNGGRVALQEIADISIVPTANAVNRENLARRIHVEAELNGLDLATAVDDVEDALDEIDFPTGYYPELLGEFSERQAASRNLFRVSRAVGTPDLRSPLHLLQQPQAGGTVVLHPVDGAGRRCAGGGTLRWRPVARFAGRLPDDSRHRGEERHHADQPLSAPGAPRGHGIRNRTRAAGSERASGADPDDRADHGTGPGSAGRGRKPARSRDRVPDGHCHHRRSDHLDAGQPVHRPVAVPAGGETEHRRTATAPSWPPLV